MRPKKDILLSFPPAPSHLADILDESEGKGKMQYDYRTSIPNIHPNANVS